MKKDKITKRIIRKRNKELRERFFKLSNLKCSVYDILTQINDFKNHHLCYRKMYMTDIVKHFTAVANRIFELTNEKEDQLMFLGRFVI